MERRYQVFVSSTFRDLIEERREVMQALLELDCIPAGMELFPAADDDAWTLIERVIDTSDYYIVIVGNRYGSISVDGLSFTEREYDYAILRGIPTLAFLHESPGSIAADKSELDADARARLEAFREKVQKKVVKTYNSAQDLGSVVSRSLSITIKQKPGEGWVRGSDAATPELMAELSRLRAKVAELELEARDSSEYSFPDTGVALDDLAQGDDSVLVPYTAGSQQKSLHTTWNYLLTLLGPLLLNESSEASLIATLTQQIYDANHVDDRFLSRSQLRVPRGTFNLIMMQLRALQFIQPGTKRRGVADKETYWRLTARGDAALASLTAVRR